MSEMNRRKFIKNAGGTAAIAASASLIGPKTWAGANDRIRVGVIGINGRGGAHINGFGALENVEIAALCDADENVLNRRVREVERKTDKAPKTYTDMRKLFEDKDIDVVGIATPNHWHALATIWACQAGKDVYVEKPGSHNIYEGQKAAEAAKKYNRIVQIGSQSRSSEALREAMQKLRDGAIGEVYMAKGLCYKWRNTIGTAKGNQPIPDGVNYDLWLGPAEQEPLRRLRLHYDWHWQWPYGNGDIGNQGIHEMDKARWGLGVDLPSQVSSMGGKFMFEDDQQTPNCQIATFKYPEQNKMLVFEVRHWITNPEDGLSADGNVVSNMYYGSEGYMVVPTYNSYQIFMGRAREAQPMVSKGGDHFANFVQAVRNRKQSDLNAPYEEVRKSAALCHLANIAYRTGRTLEFDPVKENFKSDEEANAMLTRNYRAPFVVPEKV